MTQIKILNSSKRTFKGLSGDGRCALLAQGKMRTLLPREALVCSRIFLTPPPSMYGGSVLLKKYTRCNKIVAALWGGSGESLGWPTSA
jgi:hypothetical protein